MFSGCPTPSAIRRHESEPRLTCFTFPRALLRNVFCLAFAYFLEGDACAILPWAIERNGNAGGIYWVIGVVVNVVGIVVLGLYFEYWHDRVRYDCSPRGWGVEFK